MTVNDIYAMLGDLIAEGCGEFEVDIDERGVISDWTVDFDEESKTAYIVPLN
jgi:hypothetical protein